MTFRNFLTPDFFFPLKTPASKRSRLLQAVHLRAKTSACLKWVTTFFQVSLLSSNSCKKPLTQITMCLLFSSLSLTLSSYSTLHLWIEVSIWRVLKSSSPNSRCINLISYLSLWDFEPKAISNMVKKKPVYTSSFNFKIFWKTRWQASRVSLITVRSLLS